MKVFLKEDVKHVGSIGDVVNVADGYARNYLIPKNLAVEANMRNIKEFEHHKRIVQEKAAKVRDASRSLAEKISSVVLTIAAKAGEEDKLFGSVTSMDIAEALKAEGYDVDKKKIHIDEPIKRLGEHSVEIKVLADISAHVKVNVIAEASE